MHRLFAVQLPAFCPLSCIGCRTIELNRYGYIPGNLNAIKLQLKDLKDGDFLFITSTGEPGYTKGYSEFVSEIIGRGVEVAVCCANKRSILPGMVRAEISRSNEQDKTAIEAIKEAKRLNIPYIATVVNFGEYDNMSPIELIEELNDPDGIIIRQAQPEGAAMNILRNKKVKTKTQIWKKDGIYVGKFFPFPCFHEFEEYRKDVEIKCINHMGKIVEWLGGEILQEVSHNGRTLAPIGRRI